ncbi:hypothetical protein T492DRAFT_450265, partial [Pavlovales sp. CCMP2436]
LQPPFAPARFLLRARRLHASFTLARLLRRRNFNLTESARCEEAREASEQRDTHKHGEGSDVSDGLASGAARICRARRRARRAPEARAPHLRAAAAAALAHDAGDDARARRHGAPREHREARRRYGAHVARAGRGTERAGRRRQEEREPTTASPAPPRRHQHGGRARAHAAPAQRVPAHARDSAARPGEAGVAAADRALPLRAEHDVALLLLPRLAARRAQAHANRAGVLFLPPTGRDRRTHRGTHAPCCPHTQTSLP